MKRFALTKRMSAVLILAGAALAPAAVRAGPTYLENFNTGADGWIADGGIYRASGGVGNTGYLEGHRDGFAPLYDPFTALPASAHTTGNLETLYGNLIQVSFDGKVISGPVNNPPNTTFADPGGTVWIKNVAPSVGPFVGNWTHVTFGINTNWTDAEAIANGWSLLDGADSWSFTLHHVLTIEPFGGVHTPQLPGTQFVTGLDNFQLDGSLSSTPEPATLTLLGIGIAGLAGYGWRKRKGGGDVT